MVYIMCGISLWVKMGGWVGLVTSTDGDWITCGAPLNSFNKKY